MAKYQLYQLVERGSPFFTHNSGYNAPRPIFLVLDGHPVHQSGKVEEFVESTEGMLRLFILPPYSPNLNPDEWGWNWLKRHHLGKTKIKGPDQLKELVGHFLRRLQKLPRLIKGFFKDPELAYISAC